jgi:hypothetical protein
MSDSKESTKEKLARAYDRMMEEWHALMEEAEEGMENFQEKLKQARDNVAEADDLTREEADRVSQYLKRDLKNAGEYLEESGHELADWLHMDLELIEWSLLDMFLSTADRTKLDLLLMEENAKHVDEYHTGEITSPGTLSCDGCGEVLHFHKSGHIPPCPKCHGTDYHRKSR